MCFFTPRHQIQILQTKEAAPCSGKGPLQSCQEFFFLGISKTAQERPGERRVGPCLSLPTGQHFHETSLLRQEPAGRYLGARRIPRQGCRMTGVQKWRQKRGWILERETAGPEGTLRSSSTRRRLKSEMRLGVFCSCSHLMHHLTDKTICRTISLASSPPLVENMWSN